MTDTKRQELEHPSSGLLDALDALVQRADAAFEHDLAFDLNAVLQHYLKRAKST